MAHTERVVVLVDMDCFYCQVEEKLDPQLKGKPIAVVQYNAWRGGGIIAVNYPARNKGVTRHMRGNEAKKMCPEIVLARVPEVRGKADLTKYREAGKSVADVLQTYTNLLERASIDEAYLDITEEVKKRLENGLQQIQIHKLQNTFVVGCDTKDFIAGLNENTDFSESNIKLAIGGIITEEIRTGIFKQTGYTCSAGVAHNKILAKLVCGLHKPNKQTLLPQDAISELYKDLPIKKIRSLGGKFGVTLAEELKISYMGELVQFSEKELAKKFDEKNAKWLFNIARGIDLEPVTVKLISKSIGCCKRFPGRTALVTADEVEHWVNELSSEISERLEKDLEENNRRAKQMVVSFTQDTNDRDMNSSRTHPLNSYEQTKIARGALDVIRRFCLRADGSYCITFLGLSVGNFHDLKNTVDISAMFRNMNQNVSPAHKSIFPGVKSGNDGALLQNLTENSTGSNRPELVKDQTSKRTNTNSFFHTWAAKYKEPTGVFKCEDLCASAGSEVSIQQREDSHDRDRRTKSVSKSNAVPIEDKKEVKEPSEPVSRSFFLNYFKNEGRHLLQSKKSEEIPGTSRTKQVPMVTNSETLTCSDCNENIRVSEYGLHKDYHFALLLAREEPQNYEEPRDSKREPREAEKTLRLSQNGQNEVPDENAELCDEYNKRDNLSSPSKHFRDHDACTLSSVKGGFGTNSFNGFSEPSYSKNCLYPPRNHHDEELDTELKVSNNFAGTHDLIGYHSDPGIRRIVSVEKEPRGSNKMPPHETQSTDGKGSSIFAGTHRQRVFRDQQMEVDNGEPSEKHGIEGSANSDDDLFDNDSSEERVTCEGTFVTSKSKVSDKMEPCSISKDCHSRIVEGDEDLFSCGSDEDLVTEQNLEEFANLSVYSADTEELNEDPNGLIYFEDVFSESDSSEPLFGTQRKDELNDTTTKYVHDDIATIGFKDVERDSEDLGEEKLGTTNEPEEPKPVVKSFFLNYFMNEGKHLLKKAEGDRKAAEVSQKKVIMVPKADGGYHELEGKQTCPECQKKLPLVEYQSHLDYHYALKLVKEESHLYRNAVVPVDKKPSKSGTKRAGQSSKRKTPESNKILPFLQKIECLDEDNSEMCNDCNKRIKLDEAAGHADYHAAKKLHHELNSPKKLTKNSGSVKDKKNCKSVMNGRVKSNFFQT